MEIKKEAFYIVRSSQAGVFFGHIAEKRDNEVDMTDVRRLWYWDGAASLSQMAVEGVKAPGNCKFTVTVPSMTILGICEISECSEAAVRSIQGVREWRR